MRTTRLAARIIAVALGFVLLGGIAPARASAAEAPESAVARDDEDPFAAEDDEATPPPIGDPLRRVNRGVYHVNDKLYFWVLRPVSRGYKAVLPEIARVGVRNFFDNVAMPVRMVNCLFQGDLRGTGTELARFGVNTTVGVAGFGDPAKGWLKLHARHEDFGQTLGAWGLGSGCYLSWPLLGPSSLRDTLAWPVNAGLDPATYVPGVGFLRTINGTSLRLGDYEDLKASALDPYVAIRDAYNQHRWHAVKTRR